MGFFSLAENCTPVVGKSFATYIGRPSTDLEGFQNCMQFNSCPFSTKLSLSIYTMDQQLLENTENNFLWYPDMCTNPEHFYSYILIQLQSYNHACKINSFTASFWRKNFVVRWSDKCLMLSRKFYSLWFEEFPTVYSCIFIRLQVIFSRAFPYLGIIACVNSS